MWSNQYIGIPYKTGGRDRSGLDCWGLARLVYQEQYKINLPSFSTEYTENDTDRMEDLIDQYREGWSKLDSAEPGSLVLLRVMGSESHIGIVVDNDNFLHIREGSDACIEKLSSGSWSKRIAGYFKYTSEKGALVNALPHPLKTERITLPIPSGINVSTLILWISKEYEVPIELAPNIIVIINGKPIDKLNWESTFIENGDALEYRVVAGKDVVRTVAFIALAIYAPVLAGSLTGYTAAASAATLLGASVTTGLIVANAVVTAGIMLAGSMLINAIAPIRPPSAPTDPGQAERMYMFEGANNQRRLYDAIPVILGKVRMTPPIGANTFTYYKSERDQYLRMLLVWGYGPLIIDANTLKIGDTSWDNYTETKIVTLDGRTAVTPVIQAEFDALYGSDVEQIYKNITLTAIGQYTNVTPAPETPINGDNIVITTFDTIGAQTCSITLNFPEGLRKVNKQSGDSSFVDITFAVGVSTDGGDNFFSNTNYTMSSILGSQTYKKDAFSCTIDLSIPAQTVAGTVSVKIQRNTTSTKENTTSMYYYSSVVQSVQKTVLTKPTVNPVNVTLAKSALEIKATGQLSGQIEGISAVVQTYTRIYASGSWQTYAGTSNPAALFLYILTHPGNIQRINPYPSADEAEKINLAELGAWYNYCVTKGFEYNSVVGSQRSLLEVLRDICAAGRASPAIINGKWTVNIDIEKTIIAQHFTPHNSWGFESSKLLPKIPDGIKVKFFDENLDYQENEVTVYNSGKTYSTATLFESITLPGVTKKSSIYDHAKWQLSQAKVRPEIYTLNTDLEYIVCTRGDRVKIMHDVPMWGMGSGRIKNRISSTLLELDEPISIQDSTLTHTIRVRGKANDSSTANILSSWNVTQYQKTNGYVVLTIGTHPFSVGDQFTSTISVAGTLNSSLSIVNGTIFSITSTTITYYQPAGTASLGAATPSSGTVKTVAANYSKVQLAYALAETFVDSGDLFLFGVTTQEAQDLIVLNIEPTSNKTAKLTLVDYGVTSRYNLFTDYVNIVDTSNIKYIGYSIDNNIVTLTTEVPHNVLVGDTINIPARSTPSGLNYDIAYASRVVQAVTGYTISYLKPGTANTPYVNTSYYYGTISLIGGVVFEAQLSGLPYNYLNSISKATPIISSVISDESVLEVVGPGSFIVKMVVSVAPQAQNNKLPTGIQDIEVAYDLVNGSYGPGSSLVRGKFINGYVQVPGVTEKSTYRLKARYVSTDNTAGPWSSETIHTVIGKTTKPNVVSGFTVSTSSTNNNLILSWTANTEKDLRGYEIRSSDSNWGDTSYIWQGQVTQLTIPLSNSIIGTTKTYYIRSIDYNNNYSAVSAQKSITFQKPNAPTNISYVYGSSTTSAISTVTISWTDAIVPVNSLMIQEYRVEITKPNGTALSAIYVSSNTVTITADWIGNATVKIYSIDVVDTVSTDFAYATISKYKPNPVTNAYATVVDNNVLIYWKLPIVSSLPVIGVKLYTGNTFANSTLVGTKSGAFTSLFELSAGIYTYWITAIDTDNRESDPVSVTSTVSQPPDFVFNGARTADFTQTKINSSIYNTNTGNQLLMLVNTSETWTQHFTNNSKTSLQGFVDAGYTSFIQPASGVATASYEETWDFGTILGSSSVTVTTLGAAILGTPIVSTSIQTSIDNVTWSTPITASSTFATNFRYIRATILVTETSATDLYLLTSLNISLDSKLKNDAGNISGLATDTLGTVVNFSSGIDFSDVTSIVLSTNSTIPLITVYDHKDATLTGNYTISGSTVTINVTNHGLITGQRVRTYYSSGNGKNGVYTLTKVNDNTYTVTIPGMVGVTGGTVSTYPQSMRVYAYDLAGVRQDATISWAVKGY